MIKYICDTCEENIEGLDNQHEYAQIAIQEKGFDFTGKSKKAVPIMKRTEFILCKECSKKVKEFLKELKENGQTRNSTIIGSPKEEKSSS